MAANNATQYLYPYTDGDVIPQQWSPIFILFAFITSFTASYSAVRLLDHDLWRTEKEKDHASAIIIKHPRPVAAILLGLGTVWSMHFVGMAAVTLDRAPMCYDWPITLGSLVSAVFFMWIGVIIASRDIFQCQDRLGKLKKIVISKKNVTAKGRHKQAQRAIHLVAFCYEPWYILAGAAVAASGALIMHYTGMQAIEGPFRKEWSVPFVSTSVLLGMVICAVGFWILFRLLLWKVEKFWLRPASAAVIASAVCTLHFFGMLSVTYVFDENSIGTCHGRPGYNGDPLSQKWTVHQILALAVGILVPSLGLLIENLICRELFHAYAKLKDPALTVEFILEAGSRSRDTNVRRASIMTKKALAGGRNNISGHAYIPQSFGVEEAAALVAAEEDAARRASDLSSAPGRRRRSSQYAMSKKAVAQCVCTCGGCQHANLNRRVSFMDDAPARRNSFDEADAEDTRRRRSSFSRGSSFGSIGNMIGPAIAEGLEQEHHKIQVTAAAEDVVMRKGSNATSEGSFDELVAQVRIEAEARDSDAASAEESKEEVVHKGEVIVTKA